MPKQAEIKIENNVLSVCGDLDFSNVMLVYKKSLEFFSSVQTVVIIDFAGLRSTNSVALAMIMNLMRLAKKDHKTIQFKNLSVDVMSLARASGLNKIIEPVIV